jgi:hypothetical protein
MGYIGNEPTTGHFPVDNFTSSGGSTYTLSQAPASAGAIEVSVQGILQSTTAYSISGTTLTMAGVTSGVKIFVRHLGETLVLPTPADGSVTTAKLGINSVDGTKIAMGSDAQGDILYHGATDYARLAKGTAGQALVMNSGATAPEWGSGLPTAGVDGQVLTSDGTNWASEAAPGGGKVVQVVNVIDSTFKTTTVAIPHDDTIPQNTEGMELMTLAITPTSATNKLIIFCSANIACSTGPRIGAIALFQDTTVGALASIVHMVAATEQAEQANMQHYMTAGTTSATTFKLRGGLNSNTFGFNGTSSARRHGGVSSSSITIWEISA